MSTEPTGTLPTWATDTNYTNGPDAGTATKVEPSAGELAEGNIRGIPPTAQGFNWWQGKVGEWVAFLSQAPHTYVLEAGDSGDWTIPDWAMLVTVEKVSGGGGGGGGSDQENDGGGGGGGSGVRKRVTYAAADLRVRYPSLLIPYSVGAGGAGGAGTLGGDGQDGADGGDTTFGPVFCEGGKGGKGGGVNGAGAGIGGDGGIGACGGGGGAGPTNGGAKGVSWADDFPADDGASVNGGAGAGSLRVGQPGGGGGGNSWNTPGSTRAGGGGKGWLCSAGFEGAPGPGATTVTAYTAIGDGYGAGGGGGGSADDASTFGDVGGDGGDGRLVIIAYGGKETL
jgi:hypothetical protein